MSARAGCYSRSAPKVEVNTPEILWHGGGNENGKPDPVYSIDCHPAENVLLTSGIDASVPPKGSVRLWKYQEELDQPEFVIDLCDHHSAINIARFSPCGKLLASASEGQVVVYALQSNLKWSELSEPRDVERIWLRPGLTEIFDMQWSPDSQFLLLGSIDSKAEILRVRTRESLKLTGHSNYVQGVAWDPLNTCVVTQSSDRSFKVHKLKYKEEAMVKLAGKGHVICRMQSTYTDQLAKENSEKALTAADFGVTDDEASSPEQMRKTALNQACSSINLFLDSNVPSFFRRLSFSPDGNLLITPCGLHRTPIDKLRENKNQKSIISSEGIPSKSLCTHIFSRHDFSSPCISLTGLNDPSIAVRFNPHLFEMIKNKDETKPVAALIPGDYRMVFAVVTIKSVLLYDTQHGAPFAKVSGRHLAPINDASWSADGHSLAICSSDGYVSFIKLAPSTIGRKLIHSEVPTVVKKSYPAIYNYFPPKEEPVVEKKDDKVAADHLNKKDSILATELKARSTEGISEVIANKEDKKDDSNASTVAEIIVNQKFMTCDENGSVASGDQLQQMTLPPEKKRKRIAPIKIASLGEVVPSSVTSATSVRETAGTIAETKIVADGSETTGSGTIAIEHKVQAGGSPTASAALHLKKILTVTTNNDMGSSATCLSPAKVVELEPARSTPSLFSSATKKRRITPTLISPLKFTTSETGSSNTSSVNDSK